VKKQNAAAWLAILTLCSWFGFGQASVTTARQEKSQSALFTWTAEFDGHAPCVSRDVLLECAGYKQTISSLNVTYGLAIVGIEYRRDAREKHFAQALVNEGNPFIVISTVGDVSKKIYLPINDAGRSSVDGLSVSFPAGSVLSAIYFAPGPSEPIVAGKLIVHYTIP